MVEAFESNWVALLAFAVPAPVFSPHPSGNSTMGRARVGEYKLPTFDQEQPIRSGNFSNDVPKSGKCISKLALDFSWL